MKKTSLQRIKTTILDLYQMKKKKSVIYEKSDYLSLLSFIKYTNQIYPFSNSKIKSLFCEFFNSEVIKDKLISILNLFDHLSNIDEESAFNEIKKISLSTDTKFLLRFLNLYIYINNLFE